MTPPSRHDLARREIVAGHNVDWSAHSRALACPRPVEVVPPRPRVRRLSSSDHTAPTAATPSSSITVSRTSSTNVSPYNTGPRQLRVLSLAGGGWRLAPGRFSDLAGIAAVTSRSERDFFSRWRSGVQAGGDGRCGPGQRRAGRWCAWRPSGCRRDSGRAGGRRRRIGACSRRVGVALGARGAWWWVFIGSFLGCVAGVCGGVNAIGG